MGADFFSRWTFWTDPDPSGGAVRYVDFAEAMASGLVNASESRVYLGADMKAVPIGDSRRSVRIQSKAAFNEGLFVVTIDHAPTGCGLWPAFWMYGEDEAHKWPTWGEYDIIEAVHKRTRVMTSLHTDGLCDQSTVANKNVENWMPGPLGDAADNCNILAQGQFSNQGCSQEGPAASVGEEFNAAGGGTYAAEWDPMAKYIRTWFWPKGLEPPDLSWHRPDPDTWGPPYSYFSLDPAVCSPSHFVNMRLVFDITLCGDLGEATYHDECPEIASRMSCPEYVRRHPETMQDAYWSIRALDVYRRAVTSSLDPAAPGPPTGGPSGRRDATVALVVVLALVITCGLVCMVHMQRMFHAGDIRCPTFYQRCLPNAPMEGEPEEHLHRFMPGYPLDEVAQVEADAAEQQQRCWDPFGLAGPELRGPGSAWAPCRRIISL